MISMIKGSLLEYHDNIVTILSTGGVGYEVDVTSKTLNSLIEQKEDCSVYTYFMVRDDMHKLYGFISKHEKDMFQLLLKVNGVGGKVALSILDTFSVLDLFTIIYNSDNKSLQKVSGLGKKTADRVILEMKDLIKKLNQEEINNSPNQNKQSSFTKIETHIEDAKAALLVLGYKINEVENALASIVNIRELTTEDIIKTVLQKKI